jgi:hypothetical protein
VQSCDCGPPGEGVARMVTPAGWVKYQRRGDRAPKPHKGGTNYSVSTDRLAAMVVKRATFGFASEPLGECAWTARDLT